jgi:excinuclease ABC subunit C
MDAYGRVIYVGKAKNLRSRLANYFGPPETLHTRTRTMVENATKLEWTTVATEVEALALEYTWIKQFEPRFNIKFRDDKSYPFLAVTLNETFPRAQVMRGDKKTGVKYFGPFGHAWAIRETLDLMTRVFPVRTCSKTVFNRYQTGGRPCLLGYIDKCAAPCVGRIEPEAYRAIVADFIGFLGGDTGAYLTELETEMRQAAQTQDFERAAKLRDDAAALAKVAERNAVVLPETTEADLFAMAEDELEAAIEVFFIRKGRITGQRGWIMEKIEDLPASAIVTHLLQNVYGRGREVPRQVLVPLEPDGLPELTQYLTQLRGSQVAIKVPRRGDKASLAATLAANAEAALALHRSRRAGDLTTRSQALRELAEALTLDQAPLRIECYDISHTFGTNQVGSMVVFEDGLPRKGEYRRFAVRGESGQGARDDTTAMAEVLTRRFHRLTAAPPASNATKTEQDTGLDKTSFAYPPSLVVVDGGVPQVNAARRAMDLAGASKVAVIGLAKRLEEVFLPGSRFPVILPRGSEALYLLQRLRDEAHRFAITAHRAKRSKAMTHSALDEIAGLGPTKRQALLKYFGSLTRVKAADETELANVPGIGPKLAADIWAQLHGTMDP